VACDYGHGSEQALRLDMTQWLARCMTQWRTPREFERQVAADQVDWHRAMRAG
jgi:hypothetical protein